MRNAVVSLKDNVGALRAYSITNPAGEYSLYADAGAYTAEVGFGLNPNWSSTPSVHSFSFSSTDTINTGNDFLLEPLNTITDVQVSLISLSLTRFGHETTLKIILSNNGTTIETVDVDLNVDPDFAFIGGDQPYAVNGNTVTWSQLNLEPFETRVISAVVESQVLTGILTNTATVSSQGIDINTADNSVEVNFPLLVLTIQTTSEYSLEKLLQFNKEPMGCG